MIFALVTGGASHESAYISLKKRGKVILFDDDKNNYLSKKYEIKRYKISEMFKFKQKDIFFWSPCNDIGSAICDYKNLNRYNVRSKIFENGKFDKLKIFKNEKNLNKNNKYILKPRFGSGSKGIKFWNNKKFNKNKYFIQKFYKGIELSIDVITIRGKHKIISICPRIVQKYKSAIGIFSFGEYPELKKILNKIIRDKFNKLKIKNGISHIEVILTKKNDIKFIDINLRGGGAGVTEFFLKKIKNIDLFNLDFSLMLNKKVNIKLKSQKYGFILYNTPNSSHFKSNLVLHKKLGIYKKLKLFKSNKKKEIDANRTEILCAKFKNKKLLFLKLKNILQGPTYGKLIKIDKKLCII